MFDNIDPENVIVCRCEGITLSQLKEGIEKFGITDIEELKRIYRCGMGPCQGRTCEKLVRQVIQICGRMQVDARECSYSHRPPLVPIKFEELAEVDENETA